MTPITYYYSDKDYYSQLSKDYYKKNRDYILKDAKDKYNNISPEKKLKLKEYQKNYQKNYREKKKREHSNFNKNAVLVP